MRFVLATTAALSLTIGLWLPRALAAETQTQAGAQNSAANVNHKGSDDDMEEANKNVMKAIMHAAALNIPGAFAKGYEAYGNYTNSEKLDDLEAKTKNLRNSMESITQPGVATAATTSAKAQANDKSGVSRRATTFSRLNTEYLYKGEMAAVADEFEKRSGMKREELLQHLASATDSGLSFNDPNLLGKLEQRYYAFRDRIPNKEFKAGLEKAEALFPAPMRNKILGEVQAFYIAQWGGKDDGSKLAAAPPAAPDLASAGGGAQATAPASPAPAAAGAVTAEADKGAGRSLASVPEAAASAGQRVGMFIGLSKDSDALKDLLKSANIGGDDDSIFKLVSMRYRKLTPGLIGKAKNFDAR